MKLKWFEKVAIVTLIVIGCFFCGAPQIKKTSGLEVLSMCGGYYTGKALESPDRHVAIDQVDKFLDECRTAAPDAVCSHYACLITGSTEARIQRDLDAKQGTESGTSFPRSKPLRLSQDPINLTLYTPELHWEVQMVQEAPEPGHQPEPRADWSQNEKCRQDCHVQHCKSWMKCSDLTGEDRAACEGRVTDDEKRCVSSCGSA